MLTQENTSNESPIAISVVAPVFNEMEGIEKVVRYWSGYLSTLQKPCEIVVANDGSTDGTLEILQKLMREIPIFRFETYTPNRGYGYALKTAIRASKGELVVMLDSDGQFDLADLPVLLKAYEEKKCDFVTGYRMKKNDSLMRVVADRGLNLIVRTMFRVDFRDTNCAMKLVRGDLARSLNIEARGYPTPTEITVKLFTLGAKSAEVGVHHLEREAGQSKLKFVRTTVNMWRFLWYLRRKVKLYRTGILQTL